MRGRFRVSITAAIASRMATRHRPASSPAIMIIHPVNLGVPGIWGVAIVPPGTTGTEDAAIEKRKALLRKIASRRKAHHSMSDGGARAEIKTSSKSGRAFDLIVPVKAHVFD